MLVAWLARDCSTILNALSNAVVCSYRFFLRGNEVKKEGLGLVVSSASKSRLKSYLLVQYFCTSSRVVHAHTFGQIHRRTSWQEGIYLAAQLRYLFW